MKKILQLFGFILVLACFSFTKGNTHARTTNNIKHTKVAAFKKNIPTSVKSVFFYAFQVSEITISQSGYNLAPSFEEQIVKPFASNKSLEQILEFQFFQYTNTETNFLSLSLKSELIFPFHYHW